MIHVTRLDGSDFVVNAGHLLLVEHTPDTVLVLTNGHRLMVRESVDEVVRRVIDFRRRTHVPAVLAEALPQPSAADLQAVGDTSPLLESES